LADIAVHTGHEAGHGTGHDSHDAGHGAHVTSTGLSNNELAMWLFLGSECLLFGGLISTYMLYRGRSEGGPGPNQIFDIPLTSVSSFVLLMSSLTMVLAVSAAQNRDMAKSKMWMSVTALLGATFVGGQVFEFTEFYRQGLGYTTSLFGSSFYTLTGFHGVHVSIGIIMLMALIGMLRSDKVPGDKAEVVELIGLYVGNMREPHAKVRMAEVVAHLDETRFAWVGSTADDSVFYYRIHSPVILIEFDHQKPAGLRALSKDQAPNKEHVHVVIRTPNGNDYGKDLLRQHYAMHKH